MSEITYSNRQKLETTQVTINRDLASPVAERMVLGACLINQDAFPVASSILRHEHFADPMHAAVFLTMWEMHDQRKVVADVAAVGDALVMAGRMGYNEVFEWLGTIVAETPTADTVDFHAHAVYDYAFRRQIRKGAEEWLRIAYTTGDEISVASMSAEIESLANSLTHNVATGGATPIGETLGTVIQEAMLMSDPVFRQRRYRSTGMTAIDKMLNGGLTRQSLNLIAGRPSMGKTSLGLCMAYSVAKAGGSVLFFSLEMHRNQLAVKLLSLETGIESKKIESGVWTDDETELVIQGANALTAMRIKVDDTSALDVATIRAEARKRSAQEPNGLDLIVIDYVQLVSGGRGFNQGGDNRQQEISFISRSMKVLARELDVPVILLSQLNRSVESRADKRPMLSDLRESGALEQDADVSMMIYRDDYYNPDTDKPNIAEVIINKNRAGATGKVDLYWRAEVQQFLNLDLNAVPTYGTNYNNAAYSAPEEDERPIRY